MKALQLIRVRGESRDVDAMRANFTAGLPLGGPMDTDNYRILLLDFPFVF